ncbi:MAG: type II secretion system protein GspM [Legionella sp.]|nr:type II secretion system protein GspM [Legionella sp.]
MINEIKAIKAGCLNIWGNLELRDKRALCVLAPGMLLYLAYISYAALAHRVLENKQVLSEKKVTLAWMKQAKKNFSPAQHSTEALNASEGLSVFSKALNKAAFDEASYKLEQIGDNAFQLSFDSVNYRDFLRWLWSMEKRYKIEVKQLNVEKTETQGAVKLIISIIL